MIRFGSLAARWPLHPDVLDGRARASAMSRDRTYAMLTARLVRPVSVLHISPDGRETRPDVAATEEPLEIRIDGEPFAVTMRTPGSDRDLTAGFLHSERLIRSAAEIGSLDPHPDARNVIEVRTARAGHSAADRAAASRRRVAVTSACGLCGRTTIESLRVDAPRIAADWTIEPGIIASLPGTLRSAQRAFDESGGLHAAGLFDRAGRLEVGAEDVGRHNAVDKVVGRMLLEDRLPLDDALLFVSGRASYEIVQKAFLAGIPLVGAVSAPSSLAVELAEEAGITLLGFVRGAAFNVYSHTRRIAR